MDVCIELTWISRALKQQHWRSYGTETPPNLSFACLLVLYMCIYLAILFQTKIEPNRRTCECIFHCVPFMFVVLWSSFSKHIYGSLDSDIRSRRWPPVGQPRRSLNDTGGERDNIFYLLTNTLGMLYVNWLICICYAQSLCWNWPGHDKGWFCALVNWLGWETSLTN